MLELLTRYASDMGLVAEPGFARKTARWAIVCDEDGRFLEVIELGDTGVKNNPGRAFPMAPELSFSELRSGSEARSHFLIETAEVVALMFRGNESPTVVRKAAAKHDYFLNLLRQASRAMPELGLLARTLDDPSTLARIADRLKAHKARPTDKVTFAIRDRFPVESNRWHQWWREFRAGLAQPPGKRRRKPALAPCLATGRIVEPVRVQPKIKGLAAVGGLPTGDSLISFKQESFCSYGLTQSYNAPISEEAAAAYRAALNHLIRTTGRVLAGAMVVHWFKKRVPPQDDPLSFLEEPAEDQERTAQHRARELLEAIRKGSRPDLAGNYYYALTMSGAAGRVMVRDWMEGRFEELVRNVDGWFEHLSIVRRDGLGLASPPKFMALVRGLVRERLEEVPPPLVAKLWRAALRNEPIPRQALARAVARTRADIIEDRPLNHARMGLMKAYHLRSQKGGDKMTVHLNEDHPNPAYHCGRLMAVLADLQRCALGDVGAGLVQRFFAAASATPALVLGRLVRNSQFHLNKLDPGLARWYEQRLADILGRIKDQVPPTLTLEDQSLFALGYYHQIAARKDKDQS